MNKNEEDKTKEDKFEENKLEENKLEEIMNQILAAKKDGRPFYYIHSLFISYCHEKRISIYSKEVYSEILRLFPRDENPKLYQYCLWMLDNQIDF